MAEDFTVESRETEEMSDFEVQKVIAEVEEKSRKITNISNAILLCLFFAGMVISLLVLK